MTQKKDEDVKIELARIDGEFKIIKRLFYIILTALFGLLIKAYWSFISKVPEVTGNVIKNIFR